MNLRPAFRECALIVIRRANSGGSSGAEGWKALNSTFAALCAPVPRGTKEHTKLKRRFDVYHSGAWGVLFKTVLVQRGSASLAVRGPTPS